MEKSIKYFKSILLISLLVSIISIYLNSVNRDLLENFEIVKVVDGDTFKIKYNNKIVTIRIYGIDTPEIYIEEKKWFINYLKKYGSYINISCIKNVGYLSKEFLEKIFTKYNIKIRIIKKDKYGRFLALIYNCTKNVCEDLNKHILTNGLGIVYIFEKSIPRDYYKYMKIALKNRKGLWKCIK